MTPAGVTAPVRVAAVDVTAALPAIDAGGGRYRHARIVAFAGTRPLGELRVALPPTGLPPDRVARLLASAGLVAPPHTAAEEPGDAGRVGEGLLTVVVATDLARPAALRRCLAALAAQDHPRHEVIVVVNRPGGRLSDDIVLPPTARVVVEPARGASAARNRGLAEAAGGIVAFTDDDAVPAPWWLRAVARRFAAEPDAAAVSGLVLPDELETPAQVWFEDSENAFGQRYRPASFAGGPYVVHDRLADDPTPQPVYAMGPFGTGCNLAFRRHVLARLGGFDRALGPGTPARAGEDLLLLLRLLAQGGRLAYEPSAVLWHSHRPDVADLRRQVAGYGRGFTAMLTAAVVRDPRHLWGLARMLRHRRRGGPPASAHPAPAWLHSTRRRGGLLGPPAYLVGRLRLHAWRRQASRGFSG